LISAGPTQTPAKKEQQCRVNSKQKAVVRRAMEAVNAQNLAAFDEIMAPNYVRHSQATPPPMQEIKGVDGFKAFLKTNFATFPDWKETIDQEGKRGRKKGPDTFN